MSNQQWYCIDAGSDYCPCYLAETNDCIVCSHLKDKNFCDCNWIGLCIYQTYTFEGYSKKEPRTNIEANVVEYKIYGKKTIEFTLKIPHTLARQLNQPGAYIFIRNKNYDQYFDIPISIMWIDTINNLAKILIEIQGVKTKTIQNIGNSLLIRGPYWNGILGLKHLKETKNSNCLAVIRGIAQAPSVLVIKHLLKNNNTIDLIIDKSVIDYNFIQKYCNIREFKLCNLYEENSLNLINKQINDKKYNLIFIGTSDYLRMQILKSIGNIENYKIVTTNNNAICCGEGICGSCIIYDIGGIPIKTCKTQVTFN